MTTTERQPAPSVEEILARTDWPYRIGPYASLGQRYAIWTTDGALAAFLDRLYAAMATPDPAAATRRAQPTQLTQPTGPTTTPHTAIYRVLPPTEDQHGTVLRDDTRIGSGKDPHRILGWLQWAINRQIIDHACIDRLLFHAGGVVRDGHGIVLPAVMESGKTTLTTGLLDRGLAYLSDEAAAITPDRTVEGYAKPLSIDRGAWEVLPHHEPQVPDELRDYLQVQWQVPADTISEVADTAHLAAFVFPTYVADAPTTLVEMAPTDAVMLATQSVFTESSTPITTARLRELAALITAVPCYRLHSGDLADACDAVLEVLDRATGAGTGNPPTTTTHG